VLFNWEAAGRVGSEDHLGNRTGDDLAFDVIAVQMQGDGPIAAPAQLDSVPLLDPDQPHVRGAGTMLYLEGEGEVPWWGMRRRRQTKERHEAQAQGRQRAHVPAPSMLLSAVVLPAHSRSG